MTSSVSEGYRRRSTLQESLSTCSNLSVVDEPDIKLILKETILALMPVENQAKETYVAAPPDSSIPRAAHSTAHTRTWSKVRGTVVGSEIFDSFFNPDLAANIPSTSAEWCLEASKFRSVPLGVVGHGKVGFPVWIHLGELGIDLLYRAVEDHSGATWSGLDVPREMLDTVAWNWSRRG